MNKKILIVDDNKMLTKLLAKKISNDFNFEIDLAFSFADVKELLQQGNEYFVCFVDLCLPDSPNGEVVDFLLERSLPSIVLTASNDEKTKASFANKDILAYIYKESDTCVEQILSSIDLLYKHQKTKVILALSKTPERNEIKRILNFRFFNVLAAAHGEEALNYLNDNSDTKLVIADAQMPVIDGANLLTQIRQSYSKTELGVMILGEKNDTLEAELLRNNVNEFMNKPYSKDLFNARLDQVLRYMSDFALLSNFSNLNTLTGIKNSTSLQDEIHDYLKDIQTNEQEFAFAFLNIDNLGYINEEYGYDIGDRVIKQVVKEIVNETKGSDIVGHYNENKICILLKNTTSERAIKIFSLIRVNIKNKGLSVSLDEIFFTASIGITFGKSDSNLDELIEKAERALYTAKDNGKDRVEVCF